MGAIVMPSDYSEWPQERKDKWSEDLKIWFSAVRARNAAREEDLRNPPLSIEYVAKALNAYMKEKGDGPGNLHPDNFRFQITAECGEEGPCQFTGRLTCVRVSR